MKRKYLSVMLIHSQDDADKELLTLEGAGIGYAVEGNFIKVYQASRTWLFPIASVWVEMDMS